MRKLRLLSLISVAGFMLHPVLAQDTHSPAPSSDEDALRQAVSNALITSTISRGTQDTSLVWVIISVWNAPENMAFDLSFRAGNDVWPVGPLAWKKGGTNQWSYDINLPETIKQVDVCFTPSRRAADQFVRSDPYWVGDLKTIWMGAPIIRKSVPVVDMGIGLMEIRPQLALGHVDPLDEVDESDPVIQQSDRYRDRDKVFVQLQQEAAAHPENTRTLYNLGCLTVAKGNLEDAMKIFVKLSALQIPESLQRKVHRLLLIICEMNLYHADKREPAAMRLMGD